MFCRAKKTIKEYREWQLKFYTRAEDTLEQRLAGIKAAKQKLEEQMDLLSDRMLSNTVIEDWEYDLIETEETGIGNISNDNAGTSKHHLFDNNDT